ncbi:hypothetical protein AYM40_00930 [Paraburkholderia phytofirmans OLGA172]|uniref:Uncharacterized protein n=1 Tax=Paraburkholderia phytofirmans OLGA172 TaxID=1417228 RepID=A0A160FGA0_9BURK|nr:hypothetical protein AYM40_00930 [Paraburkholderia phytofirmans OLGA172]
MGLWPAPDVAVWAKSLHDLLAQRFGSAFVNLGDAGHINTAAGFGPWPRAGYFIDTLVHCAAPLRFREEAFEGRAACVRLSGFECFTRRLGVERRASDRVTRRMAERPIERVFYHARLVRLAL